MKGKGKKMGRPRTPGPKRTVVFMLRLLPEEARLIGQAAGDYPAATWVRAEVLKLARRKVSGVKGVRSEDAG